MSLENIKRRAGINQINYRTSLLVGGKRRKTRSGMKEQFTILSSSQHKKNFLKVLVPNKDPVENLYKLFPQLPPGEKPINGFSCALHKDILLQGKMIICTNSICFHSNIFGYETRVIIYFKNVLAIKREKTAFVVPNAISIRTLHKRYMFCSFLTRESSFKLLSRTWKYSMNPAHQSDGDSTPKIKKDKTHQRRTDYNENTIISTSASFNTSIYRALSLPERPHTSPPTLSGSIDFDLDNVSPRKIFKKYENLVDHGVDSDGDSTGGSNESSHSSSSVLTLTDDFSRKLKRSRSLNYLDEISTLGHRICFKNLQNIKEEMNTKNEQLVDNRTAGLSEGKLCMVSNKLSCCGSSVVSCFNWLFSTIYRFRVEHPFTLLVSILILLLAVLSISLLMRINAISEALATSTSPTFQNDICENIKLQHLFNYKDTIHSAKVGRICKMLSSNIDMVNEVQTVLKQMREKLNVNG